MQFDAILLLSAPTSNRTALAHPQIFLQQSLAISGQTVHHTAHHMLREMPQDMANSVKDGIRLMKLFVGLGNPGAKYERNRHNIGFMALDQIAADHGFSPWKNKFQAQVSEGKLGSTKVILLKPQTFMNNSGQSVGEAMRFYKLTADDVVVLHDELDLAPGKCRAKQGGGHAGHNGLRSIHAHIGADYGRIRLGIGHPGHKDAVAGYVLRDFPKADEVWLDDLMRGISDGAQSLAAGDSGKFMNAVALRVAPPRSSTGKDAAKPKASQKAQPAEAAPSTEGATEDTRSPFEKLRDKFR